MRSKMRKNGSEHTIGRAYPFESATLKVIDFYRKGGNAIRQMG